MKEDCVKVKKWHALFVWFFSTLLAIAFIGDSVSWGVVLAVAGGILFGILNWLATTKPSNAHVHEADK
jgi:hypothetical protein